MQMMIHRRRPARPEHLRRGRFTGRSWWPAPRGDDSVIDRLVIFGGTGDLAGRYLLPAPATRSAAGCIDDDFDPVCVDRKEWDDRRFGDRARDRLDGHAGETPPEARQAIVAAARHRRADIPADGGLPSRTRRTRYCAGTVRQRAVPSYVDEAGVEPQRRIETFAEIEWAIDNWRWSGTSFVLHSGKALAEDRKEVAVHFRPVPSMPFGHDGATAPNVLRFGVDPESLTLALTAVGASVGALAPLTLTARIEPPALPAYGTLLLDVLRGDLALSIHADEAEEAWRVLEPVLSGWARGLVPLEEYPAGSLGPPGIGRNR
jgi:glucose-6-phosphate 1-dehydrogenase